MKTAIQNELRSSDPEVFAVIGREHAREEEGLELIASENYVSRAVLEAQGSILTNKYAEGYPAKRYYGGCEFVDQAENLALERAKRIFGAEAANVQPHSGSQANMAVYLALMSPGDTLVGMNLSMGGHLTHGSPANFSGKLFKVASYGVDPKTHRIDYDAVRDTVKREKPKVLVAGASAYPRVIDFEALSAIARESGCHLVVDIAHIAGLVATGHHPSPLPHAGFVTTTTHKTLRGPRGGLILAGKVAGLPDAADRMKPVNSLIFPGIQGGPLMHVIAAKAVAFGEALRPEFRDYSASVVANAKALAEELMGLGLALVSGGTDNHLMLVDLAASRALTGKKGTAKDDGGVSGKDAEGWLDLAGITVNKNTIPNEKRSPFVTSGIRIGTPALTTRGLGVPEMRQISKWIVKAMASEGDAGILSGIRGEVRELCARFPLYGKGHS